MRENKIFLLALREANERMNERTAKKVDTNILSFFRVITFRSGLQIKINVEKR